MPRRYVVLGDVVASRDISDREGFQSRLRDACTRVNTEFSEDIGTEFDILKGIDEVGGVLRSLGRMYDVIDTLFEQLRPHQIRLGLAAGQVDVGTSGEVAEMDGEAFHRADELLDWLRDRDLLFHMDVEGSSIDGLVSSQVHIIQLLKDRRTSRQREVIRAYETEGSQSAVAEQLDISQPAVSKTLKRALYADVAMMEERLRKFLEETYS